MNGIAKLVGLADILASGEAVWLARIPERFTIKV
jgi:hypothetical protein